ncbi:arsenate reductase ArsC [Sorangium cellulosum]|uniref:arsenate reductase ArsC n=1 Tax=Sorangium cellulosum TaxID=56 RepID=UPI0003FCBE2B|nr:arsenate reductase ArsC [Sorangium cellulosum]
MSLEPVRVLFLCTGNSCRSQMAEGLARWAGGSGPVDSYSEVTEAVSRLGRRGSRRRVESYSAGSLPRSVHPLAVRVMADIGIDISMQRSKPLDEFMEQRFDFVITVCDRARESCPTLPTHREQIHWSVKDPAEATGTEAEVRKAFERARDELQHRIRLWMLSHRISGR